MIESNLAIDDTGQYIPYAKKHLFDGNAKGSEPFVDQSPSKDKPPAKLSDIWPEPDWCKFHNEGMDVGLLAYICGVYSRIAQKPYSKTLEVNDVPITPGMWESAYVETITWIMNACKSVSSLEEAKKIKDIYNERYPVKTSLEYLRYASGLRTPRGVSSPFHTKSQAHYYWRLLPLVGWPHKVNHKKLELVPLKFRDRVDNSSCYILVKILPKCHKYREFLTPSIKNEFPSFEAAANALVKYFGKDFIISGIDNAKEKISTQHYNPKKEIKSYNCVLDNPVNYSADQLLNDFWFRGIQFGNSLSQKERHAYLNNTYYALTLLSKIMNIPHKWIGAGSLGLAFGARGKGKASAHYEVNLHVINLTRKRGPGSLAHELMHTFDARMLKKWSNRTGLLSENIDSLNYPVRDFTAKEIKQVNSFKRIYDACTLISSDYVRNAKNISNQKGARKYWDQECELLARAFESYIQDCIDEQDIAKQWLALGTREKDYPHNGMHPYPCGKDRARINKVFHEELPILFGR